MDLCAHNLRLNCFCLFAQSSVIDVIKCNLLAWRWEERQYFIAIIIHAYSPPSLSQEKLSRIEPKVKFLVWPFFEPKCYPRAVLTLVRIKIYHYEEYEDGEKWAIKCSFTWVISYLSTEICYDHSLRSVISFIPYDVLLFISCAIGKTKVSSHGCFAQQGKMRSQTKQFAITQV